MRVLLSASFEVTLARRLPDKSTLNVSTGYVSSRLRLPQNDNDVLGIISSGYTGGGQGTDSTEFPTWGFFPPRQTFQTLATQDVERFTGSAQADWRPIPWLSGRPTLGLGVTQ